MRIIMHVDMDYFFAAIEIRERPELANKPVIVGANPRKGKGRGVVSTCNYVARKFGIKSGMPISKAWKLCPSGVYLPVRIEKYIAVSERIMRILRKYSDKFEQVSIDEAFLDVSRKVKDFEEAKKLAKVIKEEIKKKEGLTCSIGIAPNKLVAKIASDFKKPDGLTAVKPEDVKKFLEPLPVQKLYGIGPKTAKRLHELGIRTIGDLAKAKLDLLKSYFGSYGYVYHRMALGIDESPVEESEIIKSIGREHTFYRDTRNLKIINRTLKKLVEDVYQELKELKMFYRTVTVKVRYENFETHTHSKTLSLPADDIQTIFKKSSELIKPFLDKRKIRLIGVRISNLIPDKRQKKLINILGKPIAHQHS